MDDETTTQGEETQGEETTDTENTEETQDEATEESTQSDPIAEVRADIAALREQIVDASELMASLKSMLSEITLGTSIDGEDGEDGTEDMDYPEFDLDELARTIGDM